MGQKFEISYLKWSGLYESERPFMLFIELPEDRTDQRRSNVDFENRQTEITDIRATLRDYSLRTHGFKVKHVNYVSSWNKYEDIVDLYLPAVKTILQQEFPDCDDVFITSWRQRESSSSKTKSTKDNTGADLIDINDPFELLLPASNAHTDTCPLGALRRISDCFHQNGITRGVSRARIVNVWRPIYNPVYHWPLAICDASSVSDDDLVQVQQVYPTMLSTPMFVKFNPNQRWYYLREQGLSEAWIFKQFDSDERTMTRFCPHVAFFDPDGPIDAPPRTSVEVRAVVLNYED